MAEHGASEGLISRAELAELSVLFDRFEHALDPNEHGALEARAEFEKRLLLLFDEKVQPAYPRFPYAAFAAHCRTLCRRFLRANPPPPAL